MSEPANPAGWIAGLRDEPAVLGLVLSGSQAHAGMPTPHSDHDLHVITADEAPAWLTALDGFRSPHLDLVVMPLAAFRRRALPGDEYGWARYAYVHARLLFDRLGGTIGELLDRKRTLSPAEARRHADGHLDAYLNQTYRSLKSHRDGRPELAHLDAAESLPFLLESLFALHRRVRPYNKYLEWELSRHPLGAPTWQAGTLLPRLRRILATGEPAAQRALFADVERLARARGHGEILDSWGTDLLLLRPPSRPDRESP
ncbi:hypothetical protein D7294_01465 [Streptomyces hoynatensis]|uniref:Nucleotidyltransferase domain-containing protein n=1 Tax=Streptomyces hoynatensis TaxID=1141874 RepID=A0A3A9ZG15_9ACTN|nr:hypothetical protein D7294_01465 [Streptomyces hoynatensis]